MTDEPNRTASPEEDPLAWEAQNSHRVGLIAALAGTLGLTGTVVTGLTNSGAPNADDRALTLVDTLRDAANGQVPPPGQAATLIEYQGNHAAGYIAGALLTSLSLLLTFPALAYLYRAARARGTGRAAVPRFALIAAAIGAAGAGIGQAASQTAMFIGAANFANGSDHTNSAAFDVQNEPLVLAGGLIAGLGALALAVGFLIICLHAMRVGLLTRLMGIVGMFAGATLVIRFLDPPGVIRSFWLIALGMLVLGRFPRGRPPAWSVAEAVPWPTQQQVREQREAARREAEGERERPARRRGGGGGGADDNGAPTERAARVPAPRAPQPRREDAAPGRPHPSSKKRKRKRR
jgi:hypothetical protein